MPIDFDTETFEISNKLSQVEGYLDCEKIIVQSINKQLENGNKDENIILYLKKISTCLRRKIATNQLNLKCTNYRYAVGFIDTLLKIPYWKNWMKTIET